MNRRSIGSWVLPVTALVSVVATPGFANDQVAREALDKAEKIFAERSFDPARGIDPAQLNPGLEILRAAEGTADDGDLNYKNLILQSRMYYWQGVNNHSPDDADPLFLKGRDRADTAKAVDAKMKSDFGLGEDAHYADAYFYAGINLGRYMEHHKYDVFHAMGWAKQYVVYMEQAMIHDTIDGKKGKLMDGYGPDRALGYFYLKAPTFAGGSTAKAKEHLSAALAGSKNYVLNVVYDIEYLVDTGDKEAAKVKMAKLLAQDPRTFNPDRVPETLLEFEYAKKIKKNFDL